MRARAAVSMVTLLFLVNCATTNHGPLQRIRIKSDPPGARVHASRCGLPDGTEEKVTPATLWVSRRATKCTIRLTMRGYRPAEVELRRVIAEEFSRNILIADSVWDIAEVSQDSLGDLLIAGGFGLMLAGAGAAVDATSGAMFEQTPSRIELMLRPERAGWRAGTVAPNEQSEDPDVPDAPATPQR